MVKLSKGGAYLINGTEIIEDSQTALAQVAAETGSNITSEEAAKNTIAYGIPRVRRVFPPRENGSALTWCRVLLLLPLRAGGRWRAHRPLPLREDQGMRSPRRRRRRWCACGSVRPPQNRTLRGQRMHPDSLHACDGHVPP